MIDEFGYGIEQVDYARTAFSTHDLDQVNEWVGILLDKRIKFMIKPAHRSHPHLEGYIWVFITDADSITAKKLVEDYGFKNETPLYDTDPI